MNVLFPSREAYLLHRLQAVEERMTPLWPIRDVHFVVMWLLAIACIICSGVGWYRLILPIGALSVIAVFAFSHVAMKIHPLRNHRDWLLNELSELDWEKYSWLQFARVLPDGDRFSYSRRIRELKEQGRA